MTSEVAVRELVWGDSVVGSDIRGKITTSTLTILGFYRAYGDGYWFGPAHGVSGQAKGGLEAAQAAAEADYQARIRSALTPQQDAEQKPVAWRSEDGSHLTDSPKVKASWETNFGLVMQPLYAAPTSSYDAGVAAVEAVIELVGNYLEGRARYFDGSKGHYDREQAAGSYRATARELAPLMRALPASIRSGSSK